MKFLRAFFCGFSLLASGVALAQHLGVDLWGCASCSFVDELPISTALAWGGPIVLIGLLSAQYWKLKGAEAALAITALGSSSLVAWMLKSHVICPICMLVHIGVLSGALTLIPRPRFIAPLAFSLAVIFSATGGLDRFSIPQGTAMFRPRIGESIPDGKVFVLFTDPECGRCQLIESQIAKLPVKPNLLYRWSLLPHSMYRSIRAATLLEMARIGETAKYEELRGAIAKMPPPLTDSVLLDLASKIGLAKDAKSWLESPSQQALTAIADDQSTTLELKLQSLPALAELSPPDETGQRTIRLVPLSAIGI